MNSSSSSTLVPTLNMNPLNDDTAAVNGSPSNNEHRRNTAPTLTHFSGMSLAATKQLPVSAVGSAPKSTNAVILQSAPIPLVQLISPSAPDEGTWSLPTLTSRPSAAWPSPTTTPRASSQASEEGATETSARDMKISMQEALKQFNARVLAERDRDEARKERLRSRTNSMVSFTVAAPVDHLQTLAAPVSPSKPSPYEIPLGECKNYTDGSSSSGTTPQAPERAAARSPPRTTTVSQSAPQFSPPRISLLAAASNTSGHLPPSAPVNVTRDPTNSLGSSLTRNTAASSSLFAQGLRTKLPCAVQSNQAQQLEPATVSPVTGSRSDTPSTSGLPLLEDTSTPHIVSSPLLAKTGAGQSQIAAARLLPPPHTSTSSMPKLPDRCTQDNGVDEQKNGPLTLKKPLEAPIPSMPSPAPMVSPVYSVVEIHKSVSQSAVSPGGRGGPLNNNKRCSAKRNHSGQATANETTTLTVSHSSSSATASHSASQPTGVKLSHKANRPAPLDVESWVAAAPIPPPLSSQKASARSLPGAPSRTDNFYSGEPHCRSTRSSNRDANNRPLAVPSGVRHKDKRPGQSRLSSAAAKEEEEEVVVVAAASTPMSPKPPFGGHATAGQSVYGPASKAIPAPASKSRCDSSQHPDSALNHPGRYSPGRANPSAGTATGQNASGQSRSPADGAASGVDAESAALNSYLEDEDLNLSMSTFHNVGATLALSRTLRALNLKGSTIPSEGLRGLADISTLKSICVSHMRYLTTLVPLVTPTARSSDGQCGIEEIDAQFSSLTNEGIWGLEKLRRLRRLDLSMTSISDVTCLVASHSLSDLHLTGTRVDSQGLAGLERLPSLALLNVARTKVTSLKQIARSRSIRTLIAYSCHITDDGLLGVGEMPRLTTLDVSTTKVTNLSLLRKSRSLTSLRAQWLSLKNCNDIIQQRRALMDGLTPDNSMVWRDTEAGFCGLASIPTLESLDLSFNTIRNFHSLCGSKSLRHLILRRTRVDNGSISSISQLAKTLESLVITNLTDVLDDNGGTEVSGALSTSSGMLSSIGDMHMLRRLTSIDLSFTDVYDLRALQDLPLLRELIIVETLVTVDGLRGIEQISTLEILDISQTSIASLQFLVGGAPALTKILIKSNRNIRGFQLGHIHRLRALRHLDISDTVVEKMEAALKRPIWRLKELVWRWKERRDSKGPAPALECWVTSPRLVGLSRMPCLTTLDLTNSSVHDLTFLERSPSLTTLYLKCCRLLRNSTIKGLGTLPALETLELTDNRYISDVRCLCACRRLRELRLNHTCITKAGLTGVTDLPELKVLDIANTRADDDVEDEAAASSAMERNCRTEESNLREGSTLLDSSATPAQFRVPRRRRVSFVVNDGNETPLHKKQ
ncbi:hypothetical protein JKF63_05342 [Porcisia hertigi]|uniref:Uncharacterized protein n=1 Tax=Porcisia hertigi TaxID=2761500 RepID=A0A836IG43_9TRYP|nr:hypothetical protein JKF63_05342 [Porcisia hertigi]